MFRSFLRDSFLISTPDHRRLDPGPVCDNTCDSSDANPWATGSLSNIYVGVSELYGAFVFVPRLVKQPFIDPPELVWSGGSQKKLGDMYSCKIGK